MSELSKKDELILDVLHMTDEQIDELYPEVKSILIPYDD